MTERQAIDRVRTLLLRGDNALEKDDRARAVEAFEEARSVEAGPAVPDAVRELTERRLEALR